MHYDYDKQPKTWLNRLFWILIVIYENTGFQLWALIEFLIIQRQIFIRNLIQKKNNINNRMNLVFVTRLALISDVSS